jgi:hypothetical protein
MNINRTKAAETKAPLEDGDNMPNIATIIVIMTMKKICTPEPTRVHNKLAN